MVKLSENVYYHGTSEENAASILTNGIDPTKYKSGMFVGFYLSPSLSYFNNIEGKWKVILAVEIDDSKIIDTGDITDKELSDLDPHFKWMSFGYKNHLMTKYALSKGYSGVRNGREVILFNDKAIKSIKKV
jgi:hypothetical protein